MNDGPHRYVISYRVADQVRRFDRYDEVYCDATGNYWTFPIVSARGYTKEFSCVAREQASYPAAPADWKASSADEQEAVAVLNSYYAKRDRGDFAGSFAMFQPGVLGDLVSWSAQEAVTNKKIGTGTRRVTGVTWYVNPDAAPHPGIYVAIDFVGDFPSTYFYCGYLALYRRGPGSYEITREEQNMFTHGDGKPDPTQVQQMRSAMCRG